MKDMNGNWTFPKGKIERGEQPEASAVREIEEEVGIKRLSLVSPLTPSRYWYYRNGTIRKTVYYYLFRSPLRAAPRVQTEEGITDAVWTLWQDAYETVGYPETNVPLLREAERALPPT